MRRARRQGVSAVEMLVCIGLLAFVLVPILTSVLGGRKKAVMTENHVLAQMRANLFVELLCAQGFEPLAAQADAGGGTVPVPMKGDDAVLPPSLRDRWSLFEDRITFERVSGREADLGLLTVTVTWKPQDGVKAGHEFTTHRLVTRTARSLGDEVALEQKG